jgi:hypothetical protein
MNKLTQTNRNRTNRQTNKQKIPGSRIIEFQSLSFDVTPSASNPTVII